MELILKNKDSIVFEDKESGMQYTMVNMGEYIGSRDREWYQDAPDDYYLTAMEEIGNKKGSYQIEGLIDQNGKYLRIMMSKGNLRRVVMIDGEFIVRDSIFIKEKGKQFDSEYTSFMDLYREKNILLSDYLATVTSPVFMDDDNFVYEGEFPGNGDVLKYLEVNNILRESINKSKTLK